MFKVERSCVIFYREIPLFSRVIHLEITKEQVERTDSILSDVDVATEMSNFTKFQVLTQSATSMLAQANALPQMVLKLLA